MSNRFTKIGVSGETLPADATDCEAVRDNTTGLIWDVKDYRVDHYRDAAPTAAAVRAAGFSNWRLPTVEELFLLPDRSRINPAIDTASFPDCKSDWYWTSTPYAPSPGDCAWGVYFSNGYVSWGNHYYHGFVRAVCAGQ